MAPLSAKNWCTWEKFEDLSAKTFSFLIGDVIKSGLSEVCHNVTRGTEVDGLRQQECRSSSLLPQSWIQQMLFKCFQQ